MNRGRDFLILAGVLLGIALGAWLVIAWIDYDKRASCAALGRRNCESPILMTH